MLTLVVVSCDVVEESVEHHTADLLVLHDHHGRHHPGARLVLPLLVILKKAKQRNEIRTCFLYTVPNKISNNLKVLKMGQLRLSKGHIYKTFYSWKGLLKVTFYSTFLNL